VLGKERLTVVPLILSTVAHDAIPVPETKCPTAIPTEEVTVIELVAIVPVAVVKASKARYLTRGTSRTVSGRRVLRVFGVNGIFWRRMSLHALICSISFLRV